MIAEYTAYRKYFSPEEWRVLRKWELDPHMPSGKDMMYNFLRLIGEDIEYDEVFNFEDGEN
ncbi:hypothetical protein [Methanobrevibacter sp.]|uniref:hypothetical protein n=1 Tax=Methanobrevibacter sp. TaxID=66852 RepID=UPI0026DFE268|nr:hypothetical protein [Methanobrevibacter sp.]MDO5859813.1 hypothetical protein [Methanobrevibacter sp.]